MNLLLLLSALLSALTGVSAEAARVPVAAERAVLARAAVAAATRVAPGRTNIPPHAVDLTGPLRVTVAVVRLAVATVPAFASRRRE